MFYIFAPISKQTPQNFQGPSVKEVLKSTPMLEKMLHCTHVHTLQSHNSVRFYKTPSYKLIHTDSKINQHYETKCLVHLASPNISPKIIL
jgi:hypothetical protein